MTERSPGRRPKRARELGKFGFVMAGAWTGLAWLLWWRSRPSAPYLLALAVCFLVPALVRPKLLAPVERVWMTLAEAISAVMTRVIVTLMFYLVMTPVGLCLRLSKKDTLGLRFDRAARSYWIPVELDGPGTRPDKPY